MFEKLFANFNVILVLLGVGVFVALGAVIILVACRDKQPLSTFVPLPFAELPKLDGYASAMNEAVAAMAFQAHGTRAHAKGGTYRMFASLWHSPTQETMAFVGAGKLARIKYKKTLLYSQTADGRYLVTTDSFGGTDLSGLMNIQVVLKADFYELTDCHRRRLASLSEAPIPFLSTRPWDEYGEMECRQVVRLTELGYARYADPAQTTWQYTLRGAWKLALPEQTSQVRAAKAQRRRLKLERPGDAGYVPSPMRSRKPVSTALRHSGCGIASFILALTMGVLGFGGVLMAWVLEEDHWAETFAGVGILLAFPGALTGLILGSVALFQENRYKVFAILGMVLNALLCLFIIGLMALGMTAP